MVSKYVYYWLPTYLSSYSFLLTLTGPRRRRLRRGSSSSPRRSDRVDGYTGCVLQFFYCDAGAYTFNSIKRARRRRRRARTRPGEHDSHDLPDATTPTHSPFPHRPRRRRGHYPRSTLAVTRGRNFVDIGNILRYWVHNYRLTWYLTPRPRRQTCPFETATCGAVSPFPSACAATTDRVRFRLKRRAAVLVDVLALPVRAPNTTSR